MPRMNELPPDDKRCVNTGVKSSPDGRCRKWRQEGGTQCAYHGNAPRTQSAIQRRNAEKAAKHRVMKRLEKDGYPRISGPEAVIDMLEDRVSVQYAMAQGLDFLVAKLLEEDAIRYEHQAGEQLRGEIQAWLAVNQMVAKLGTDLMKLDLAGKRAELDKANGELLARVLTAILDRLELTSAQRKLAAVAIPEELGRVVVKGQIERA